VNGGDGGRLTGGPRFVGRDAELAALGEALADAANGRGGGLVLISGEPGIGKTTLAATFARRARGQGAQVAWGGAWEDSGAPPVLALGPGAALVRAERGRRRPR